MYEEEDEDIFNAKPPQAPPLPSDVHAKRFVKFEQLEHLRYPGGEVFAKLDDNVRDVSELIDVRNPLARSARISIFMGSPPSNNYQVRCEKQLIPAEFRCPEGRMMNMLARQIPVRMGYLRVLLDFAPGATERIPRHWLRALRVVRDGIVQSGGFPHIEVIGEEDPPPLASCFIDRAPAPIDPERRRRRP